MPDPESELQPEGEGEGEGEMGNGAAQEEGGGEQEPPARMDVKISGTPSAVQAAAKKVSGQSGKRPAPAEEPPEEDENAPLLADPKNMVIVTRQLPRVWELPSGQKVRCAFKVDRYGCPMRREEIEEDVFDRFGGKKYNVTIHPNTTTGENTILGAFTIEHPNPDEPPYIEDPEGDAAAAAEAASRIPGGTDPTLRETDSLANMKASLERRLDRARIMKEVREMEKLAKEAERELDGDGKPSAPSAPAGPDPRDREIAELRARLEKKEIDDRFVALQTQIAETNRLIQT
ncbi:MAG: hypothetical protein ACRD1Z_22250, partial [Vicinamibacteria bacterium]